MIHCLLKGPQKGGWTPPIEARPFVTSSAGGAPAKPVRAPSEDADHHTSHAMMKANLVFLKESAPPPPKCPPRSMWLLLLLLRRGQFEPDTRRRSMGRNPRSGKKSSVPPREEDLPPATPSSVPSSAGGKSLGSKMNARLRSAFKFSRSYYSQYMRYRFLKVRWINNCVVHFM